MDLLKQDKALEEYKKEYDKNKMKLMDEINDIYGRFDYDTLRKYNADLSRFKRETSEAMEQDILTPYQLYMARKWLNKRRIRNMDILLWYLIYKYARFNYFIKELEKTTFLKVNKMFVEETEKQCKKITGKDYKIDYKKLTDEALLEPNNLGYVWETYKDSTVDFNANEMYNELVVGLKQDKQPIIEDVINRQENRIVKIKKKEYGKSYSGALENQLDFVTTYSQLQIFQKYGIERVKWISVVDDRTCKECESLDGKEFNINDWNEFVKYENDDKEIETFKVDGIEIGVNAPPIHISCRCYLQPIR